MAKGQIESIGLVIVVVLVILIIVISLPFILKEDEEKDDILLSLNADSLRNSVLSYSLCEDVSVKEEIISCDLGNSQCESCENLENEIENMINSVLEPNILYEFEIESRNPIKIGDTSSCLNVFSSSPQPLASGIKVKMNLCRK